MPQLVLAFVVAALLAFTVGMHGRIERAIFTSALSSAAGVPVEAESVSLGLHGAGATNLVLGDHARFATIAAKQAHIELDVGAFFTRAQDKHVKIVADDATLSFARLPAGRELHLDALQANVDIQGTSRTFQAKAELGGYPVEGSGTDDGTTVTSTWTAAQVPIAPLVDAWAPADLVASDGMLRSVEFHAVARAGADPRIDAHATLDGGAFTIGGKALKDVHGEILIDGSAARSSMIAGKLDGAPISLLGQLEAKDAGRFEQLVASVAAEPDLREARIEAVAPGVAFAKYRLESPHGRLAIHVASVDPSDPTISFNTVLAGDHVTSGGERTSTMGQRTGAVLGLDGDYFDIGQSYAPQGIVIRSGALLRSPVKRMALSIHRGNHITFDEYSFEGSLKVGKRTIPIASFNDYPPGKITIVTPEFGKLRPKDGITFVALAPLATPHRYRVTSVGPITEIRPAEFGLVFGRWAAHKPPRVGENVELEYHTIPSSDDVITAVGGGPLMIKDGAWIEDPDAPARDEHDVRWPVVGVGRLADDAMLFFEVDGRWPDISVGMTRPEFGELMLRYHVVDGFALDSGGSATIVSRVPGDTQVSVRSHPSDQSYERYVTDAFFVYSSAPAPVLPPKETAVH